MGEWVKFSAALVVAAMVSGCTHGSGGGSSLEPKVFAFNYKVQSMPSAARSSLIASIADGEVEIGDLLGSNACNFTADFTPRQGPGGPGAPTDDAVSVHVSGSPSANGFNVSASSVGPGNLASEMPESCETVDEFDFKAGRPSDWWRLGEETKALYFNLTLNGDNYNKTYFRARLLGYRSNRYAIGEFDFVDVGPGDKIVLGTGSFSLRN